MLTKSEKAKIGIGIIGCVGFLALSGLALRGVFDTCNQSSERYAEQQALLYEQQNQNRLN